LRWWSCGKLPPQLCHLRPRLIPLLLGQLPQLPIKYNKNAFVQLSFCGCPEPVLANRRFLRKETAHSKRTFSHRSRDSCC
jgi:hypothetical protein